MTQLDLVTDDGLDELRAAVGDGNAELQTRGEASLDLNQLLRIADGKEQADRATLDRIYLAHAAGCLSLTIGERSGSEDLRHLITRIYRTEIAS